MLGIQRRNTQTEKKLDRGKTHCFVVVLCIPFTAGFLLTSTSELNRAYLPVSY